MAFGRFVAWIFIALCCASPLEAADLSTLPDTQTPEFSSIVTRYNSALSTARGKHVAAMTQHVKRYLDEAGEMLKEKRKARNTTGIAIATTASSIFEAALSNLTTTGTFELPAKIRRELENTIAEFNTGRSLIDAAFASEKTKLIKQFSDEFAAQILKASPALTSPDARAKMDERFLAMTSETQPPPSKPGPAAKEGAPTSTNTDTNAAPGDTAATSAVIAESGASPSWTPVGTLTATIRSMEVLEIPLAEMRLGSNSISQFSAMSGSTLEILFCATQTNFTSPTTLYRLLRIPKYNEVSIMDWPSSANGYHLNLRTPSPERVPFLVGFELQVSALAPKPAAPPKRLITLAIRSTPPGATVHIDGISQPNTVTPCNLKIPVGVHDFRLSLEGYQELVVTNYNFTVYREISWPFKPITAPAPKH